jgi:DNA-binding LacI/PurR family transcriptional regulator
MYTIGLLVDYLEMSYTNRIIQGCIRAAKERGINLIIYPGSALKEERDVSLEQVGTERYSGRTTFHRNILYEFAMRNHLDGMIVSAQTVGAYLSEDEFETFLKKFHVPILLLEQKKEGYSSLTFADNGIEIVLKHLIHECGRKHIAYISGPVNNADAAVRLENYKRVMREEGLDYKEEWIAYGDFSPFCENAVKELIGNNRTELDAICVANDAMCIPVYRFLQEYGMNPGKEIVVTGYDNTDIATDCKPQLTSVNANAEVMGYQAVLEMMKLFSGEKICARQLPVELVIRASTLGEGEGHNRQQSEMQTEGLHNKQSMKNIYINSIATDMLMYPNDRKAALDSAAYNLSHAGVDEFYVYLYENSFVQKRGDKWNIPEYVEKYVAYNEREYLSEVGDGIWVKTESIMKQEWSSSQQKIMTAFPIEVMGEHYGLIYMSYHTDLCMDVFSIANQFATVLHIYHLIEQLKDATEAKSIFLANMSHEIRTPLNAVLGMNEMILRECGDESVVGYATNIERSGKTLLALINEILDLSKIESGKMEIVPVEYQPAHMLADLYHMIAPRAAKKDLNFEMSVDEKMPSGLYGDDVRIKQIITNLLTNAVKYTPEGSVKFKISRVFSQLSCIYGLSSPSTSM